MDAALVVSAVSFLTFQITRNLLFCFGLNFGLKGIPDAIKPRNSDAASTVLLSDRDDGFSQQTINVLT